MQVQIVYSGHGAKALGQALDLDGLVGHLSFSPFTLGKENFLGYLRTNDHAPLLSAPQVTEKNLLNGPVEGAQHFEGGVVPTFWVWY